MQRAREEAGSSGYYSDPRRDGGLWTGELVEENVIWRCSGYT